MTPGTSSRDASALQPLHHTPRTQTRPTDGPLVAAAAPFYAGGPLWPWQRRIVDVARERDEHGQLCYDEVIVIVGRRAGKTRITHGIPTTLALTANRAVKAAATAQNQTGAAKRLRETWAAFSTVATPSQAATSRLLTGVNHAAIEWRYRRREGRRWVPSPATLARLAVFPPTSDSVRGDDYEMLSFDECLTFTKAEGEALQSAASPTTADHHGSAQMWFISNEGEDAGWLDVLRRRGRDAVQSGRRHGTCFVEYAMTGQDDPTDPAVWWRVHPAMGHRLTESAMRAQLDRLGTDTFAREFLDYRPPTPAHLDPLPAAAWRDCQHHDRPTMPARVVLAVDAPADGSSASIVAAWVTPDGPWVELVDRRPGVTWAADELAAARGRGHTVVADLASPARDLVRTLQHRNVRLTEISTGDYTAACVELSRLVRERALRVLNDPDLDTAAAAAVPRRYGDRFAWDRRAAGADLSPLTAATMALWHARRAPTGPGLVGVSA